MYNILIAFLLVILLILIPVVVVSIIAYWKLFTKAGEKGWKALIPLYSTYTMYKLTWKPMFFWVMLGIGIVDNLLIRINNTTLQNISWLFTAALIVVSVIFLVNLAKSYGKGVGFAIGLIFLNPIFLLILAFGSSQYIGPMGVATKEEPVEAP